MGRANNGSGLRDRLARGEEDAFAEVETALRAAKGAHKKASDIIGVSKATLDRALADHLRLRKVRDEAAGRERPLSDLLLEVPPGSYPLALFVEKRGSAESSLRQALAVIIG